VNTLVVLLVASQTQSNWNELNQTLVGRNGVHRFRVEIACRNFLPRGRKIEWKKDGYNYFPAIGGRRTWGFDGMGAGERKDVVKFLQARATEIRTFKVQVDGRPWRVPRTLTFDLLNLDLNSAAPNDRHGKAFLSKDGKVLTLSQDGSDGTGGYQVRFQFRSKGPVERKIYPGERSRPNP
jgi:hypothetical protein